MEFLTIFLSGLLSIASPVGIILDSIAESEFRQQFEEVEQVEIRIDNIPSYQIISGQVQRIRLASRGVYLTPNFRLDTLELETDPIDINLDQLKQGNKRAFFEALNQPLQGAFRIVITEEDLNNLLKSPQIQESLPEIINQARGSDDQNPSFELLNPEIDFLENNRLALKVQFQRVRNNRKEPLDIVLEMGLESNNGKNVKIVNLTGTINDQQLSQRLLNGFAEGITERLNLSKLEEKGIIARFLQLQIDDNNFHLAGFARLEPNQ